MAARSKKKKTAKKKAKTTKKKTAPRRAAARKTAKRKAAPARKAAKKSTKKKATAKKAVKKSAKRTTKKSSNREIGEGNYKASQNFRKSEESFIARNRAKLPKLGKEAEAALEGPEGKDLMAAEAESRARGEGMDIEKE